MENTAGQFFFKPNPRGQDPQNQRFCYKKIVKKLPSNAPPRAPHETEYPIYVVIGSSTVTFFCSAWHGQPTTSGAYPSHYGTGQIASFTFGQQDMGSIAEWLAHADGIGHQLIDGKIYENSDTKKQNSEIDLSFSNLSEWKIFTHKNMIEDLKKAAEKQKKTKAGEPEIESAQESQKQKVEQNALELLTHRELATDFLFDLFHSNVFNDHPCAAQLKTALLSNPMSQAVIAKGNFYYFYERAKRNAETQRNGEREWLLYEIGESAQKWLEIIRRPDAHQVVKPEMERNLSIFEDLESEHQQVFKKLEELQVDLPLEQSEHSSRWLLSRYDLLGSIRRQFYGYTNSEQRDWQYAISAVLALLAGCCAFFLFRFDFPPDIAMNVWIARFLCLVWLVIALAIIRLAAFLLERLGTFIFYGAAHIRNRFRSKENQISWARKGGMLNTLISMMALLQALMPKAILVSILVWGWLKSDDNLKNILAANKDDGISTALLYALFILSFGFILSKFHPLLPIKKPGKKTLRLLERWLILMGMSFLYSFLIGCGFYAFIDLGMDKLYLEVSMPFPNLSFVRKLPMSYQLFVCSSICSFIGILIEMSTSSSLGSLLKE